MKQLVVTKSKTLIITLLASVIGVIWSLIHTPPSSALIILLILAACGVVLYQRYKKYYWYLLVSIALGMLLGLWRGSTAQLPNQLITWAGPQSFDAVITADPVLKNGTQQLIVAPYGQTGKVQLTVTSYQTYHYGDLVWVTGKMTIPKNSGEFDYQKYLAANNIYLTSYYPKVIILKHHQGSRTVALALKCKQYIIASINATMSKPESGLMIGMLLGAKEWIDQSVIDAFTATGITHIVAVSGFNITIIIATLEKLRPHLGRKLSALLSTIIIIAFVIMTGASSSVIRASIMGLLVLIASRIGRLPVIGTALVAAGAGMILWNPFILFWDVGFQLSFLATIAIVYGVPLFEQPNKPSGIIKQALIITLVANCVTTPLLLFQFGQTSLIAPLVNILVLPLVPLAMASGALTVLPLIGSGAGFIAQGVNWTIIGIARLGSAIPHAQLQIRINLCVMLAAWLIIICLYFWFARRRKISNKNWSSSIEQPLRPW